MKKGTIILFALCMALLCIYDWQASSRSNTQSDLQSKSQFSSEKPIAQSVQRVKDEGGSFPVVDLFEQQAPSVSRTPKSEFAGVETLQRAVDEGTILALNRRQTRRLLESEPEAITLDLPTATAGTTELELVKADIYSADFTVITSSSEPVKPEKGTHYRGVVKGDPNSVAAISIFRNEVMGFYSTAESGNVVLGRVGGKNPKNRHILYAERDLKAKRDFVCGTKDDAEILPRSSIQPQATPIANKRVRIYIEADFDLYQNKGSSVANVTNYIAGFFNQSAAIYSNERIPIVLSQLFVWTTASPYNGSSSSVVLSQFQSFRNSFNGDFGHLVSLGPNLGGIAAGFSGFCNSNIDNRQCFSDVESTFNNVPTYSWTVYVFTHEMGHLMGSRHTHACVWNGNGTAIDGCSGFTEEGCALPGIPPGGGTIMSYCHQTSVGINFNNGFGPQPGSVIRSSFINAGCLVGQVATQSSTLETADVSTLITQPGVSSYFTAGQAGQTTNIAVNRTGRYVRVQLTEFDYLSLAEVQVLSGSTNLAIGRPATQYNTGFGGVAARAVDGNTDGNWANNSVTHTYGDYQNWWQVDLGSVQSISNIQVWNRTDCCSERLRNFYVFVSDVPFAGSIADKAVDGNIDGHFWNGSVTHTNADFQAWWQVELSSSQQINTIQVWNRTDCCSERLSNFYVFVSDVPFQSTDLTTTINQPGVSNYYTPGQGGSPTTFTINRTGRYVRVQLAGTEHLSLAEVQVW